MTPDTPDFKSGEFQVRPKLTTNPTFSARSPVSTALPFLPQNAMLAPANREAASLHLSFASMAHGTKDYHLLHHESRRTANILGTTFRTCRLECVKESRGQHLARDRNYDFLKPVLRSSAWRVCESFAVRAKLTLHAAKAGGICGAAGGSV
jgi:hypothetical protein